MGGSQGTVIIAILFQEISPELSIFRAVCYPSTRIVVFFGS